MAPLPVFEDVRAAASRIARHANRTPVMRSASLDRMSGAELFFKCENLQRVGAFKFRGAYNAVLSLDEEAAARGVATHSSGNHGQALALAAELRGIPATIVMPANAPDVKRRAVAGYGARIVDCEPTLAARESTLAEVVEETSATFIHPYDDARVIAGQGTAALELLEEIPELDAVLAPVGGGGLLSGTAIAARAVQPTARVIGVEPAAADDAFRSLSEGRRLPAEDPQTIADGLRTSLGELGFVILRANEVEIVTVSEAAILTAMRHVWERMKLVIEPSAAVPVAALLDENHSLRDKRVGVILSGGNVDLDSLPF